MHFLWHFNLMTLQPWLSTILMLPIIQCCDYDVLTFDEPPKYDLDSKHVTTVDRYVYVQNRDVETRCNLNINKILNSFTFHEESFVVGLLTFHCERNVKISFDIQIQPFLSTFVISHIEFGSCILSITDLDMLLLKSKARVLLMHGVQLITDAHTNCCEGFNKLTSLAMIAMGEDEMNLIKRIFISSDSLKEIFIFGCTGIVKQSLIQEKFPKLQLLDLSHCSVEGILTFPWTSSIAYLPENLSVSENFVNQDPIYQRLKIPKTIFRRALKLVKNGIVIPEEIQLSGNLHFVEISDNLIIKLTWQMFIKVHGMQCLILKRNHIIEVEELTFAGQSGLLYLDISYNEIRTLPPHIFDALPDLIDLNLSHNKLHRLPNEIFIRLNRLERLDMDNNLIKTVSNTILPIHSVQLKSVSFNNNPLQDFPVSILYIRSLEKAELRYTNLSFSNLDTILRRVDRLLLIRSIIRSTSPLFANIFETTNTWRNLDLTGSNISGFFIPDGLDSTSKETLLIILKHFKFILYENKFMCLSDIIPFNQLMKGFKDLGHWNGEEYFYTDWICGHPKEVNGKAVLTIEEEDVYNVIYSNNCPSDCKCFRYAQSKVTTIDCRNRGLSHLPKSAPSGMVDLWLDLNNITTLNFKKYFFYVRQLCMSDNILSEIDSDIFRKMPNLKILKLDRNLIFYIPKSLQSLTLDQLKFDHNPLKCDCKTLWLKKWMLNRISSIQNITEVTCQNEDGKINQFIAIPDDEFSCLQWSAYINIAIISTVIATILFVIFICI
ncbi:protein artichoke-like [Mytilus californianus]|uniref:protein artichoke-like n=1 Tax=Mytilus californianus TaxID=6549 RepID=UPI0022462D58|nr:protein artichoke-like [Mytilus californianus]